MRSVRLFVCAGVLAAPLAFASTSTKLVYERGNGADHCPDETTMRAEVAARLGYDPFDDKAKQKVVARIRRNGLVLVGTVEIVDASNTTTGSRTLTSKENDCKELASAMALAIGMAIDPVAATAPPKASASTSPPKASASTSASPPPPPPPLVEPALPPPPPPPPPLVLEAPVLGPEAPPKVPLESSRWLRLGLGGHGAFGFSPSSTWGLAAALGLATSRWSIELEGRRDVPRAAQLGVGTATAAILAVSAVPCVRRDHVALCLLASVGALQASGGSVARPRSDTAPWFAIGVRAGLEVDVAGPIGLGVHADLVAPLVRTTLRLDREDVWTTPAIAGVLGARLLAHFE